MKSWKTTILGVAVLLIAVSRGAIALLDGDPSTVLDLQAILEALAGLGIGGGLIAARDNDKSSENVGAN